MQVVNLIAHNQDVELARMSAAGDVDAQRKLMDRLFVRVRTEIRFIAFNDPDADDYVQAALVQILRSLKNYRGEAPLENWAYRIAIRTALKCIKKRRKRLSFLTSSVDPDKTLDAGTREGFVLSPNVIKMLDSVSQKYRTVIALRLVFEYSVLEIAEMLDTSNHTIRDRIYKGRKKLRQKAQADPELLEWLANTRCLNKGEVQ